MSDDGKQGDDEGAGGAIGGMAEGVSSAVGGVSDLLGEGADTEEAREALGVAEDVADGVKNVTKTAGALGKAGSAVAGGDVGGAASGIGNALGGAGAGVGALTSAVGGVVPDEAKQAFQEVSRVANTVGQVARGVGQLVDGAADLLGELVGGGREAVHYELSIADADIQFTVRDVSLHEGLGMLYEGWIEATFGADAVLDEEELLSKDVSLAIERGEEIRHFRGVVRRASVGEVQEHQVLRLDVAPALWLADETLDSRIYQDITVPDLVEKVVNELLGGRQRKVKRELVESYDPHEYLVQHRESHFQFLDRLMREEGIFFYFDHDEEDADHEVLVLGDSNSNRPLVRPSHDGVIEYQEQENQREGREVAFAVTRTQRVGASDAVIRGFDWTNPPLNVHHERTERAGWNGPRLEVYDHHHSVRHHGYDDGGGSYQSHTAERRSRMATERLDLARSHWTVRTTVVTAQPGHIFELQGADVHDGRYLIVSMSATGTSAEHGGEYTNTLNVIPADMPYRPAARERRSMPGPETATVVGPAGEEIWTDRHGRIKVQFHWDRQGQRDEHSSVWIRVAQNWAGAGWGFVFIPRIGQEVIVSFLGGDPDRPVVTGCLYNGDHPLPLNLPDEKTKSTIKTNSSLGGGGSNEVRFEDKKGEEEVYIHAEKDFNEVVEHDHTTHVKNCQTNTVDVDQTETVGHDQTMTVKHNRKKTVVVDEKNTIKGNRETTVGPDGGDDHLWVMKNRTEQVDGPKDELTVTAGNKLTTCRDGKWDVKTKGRFQVIQDEQTHFELKAAAYLNTPGNVQIKAGDGAVHYTATDAGTLTIKTKQTFSIDAVQDINEESKQSVNIKAAQKVALEAGAEIMLKVGSSVIKMTPGAIELSAKQIKIGATGGNVDVDASGIVRLKG